MTGQGTTRKRKQVFLCWSGEESREIAHALAEGLEPILKERIEFFMSDEIPKGADWRRELLDRLRGASFGIVCLTRDNLDSTWINFEAGALCSNLQVPVAPFLVGVEQSEVTDPLRRLQAVRCDAADLRRLVGQLNELLGKEALSERELQERFESRWPYVETRLKQILKKGNLKRPQGKRGAVVTPPNELEAVPLLSREHCSVLQEIARSQPYICERDLAETLNVDRNTIEALVGRLIQEGYIAAESAAGRWGRRFVLLGPGREYLGRKRKA